MTDKNTSFERLIREARIRASVLMKGAQADDTASLNRLSGRIKRRHALDIAAQAVVGVSYRDLVECSEKSLVADPARFSERSLSTYFNHWFALYEEASNHLRMSGGFLFPFRRQFVVVDAHVLRALDLDPLDLDWPAIDFDWVKPKDTPAFVRLNFVLCDAGYIQTGVRYAA